MIIVSKTITETWERDFTTKIRLAYLSTSAVNRLCFSTDIRVFRAAKSSVMFVLPQLLELSVTSSLGRFLSTGERVSSWDVDEVACVVKPSTDDCDSSLPICMTLSVEIRTGSSWVLEMFFMTMNEPLPAGNFTICGRTVAGCCWSSEDCVSCWFWLFCWCRFLSLMDRDIGDALFCPFLTTTALDDFLLFSRFVSAHGSHWLVLSCQLFARN